VDDPVQRPEEVDVGRVQKRVPEGQEAGVLAFRKDFGNPGRRLVPPLREFFPVRRHRKEELLDPDAGADQGPGDGERDAFRSGPRLGDEEVSAGADEPRPLHGDQFRIARTDPDP
jgi:hypothetical protein